MNENKDIDIAVIESHMVKTKSLLMMCVANSARSQMAEGLAKAMAPKKTEVFSAGSHPSHVNPFAVRALAVRGIASDTLFSKGLDEVPTDRIDYVITLCAEEVCPTFPGRDIQRFHWPLPDPAAVEGSDAEILASFEAIRDELEKRLEAFFASDF